jgi:hypothetical protein
MRIVLAEEPLLLDHLKPLLLVILQERAQATTMLLALIMTFLATM